MGISGKTKDQSRQIKLSVQDLAAREDVHGKPIMLVLNRPAPGFDEIEFVARVSWYFF